MKEYQRAQLAELRRKRQRVRATYPQLFEMVLHILFRHDPIDICFPHRRKRTDVYAPEVGTILPRLHTAHSVADVERILHEEFVKWFSPQIVSPAHGFSDIAIDIWHAWQQSAASKQNPT